MKHLYSLFIILLFSNAAFAQQCVFDERLQELSETNAEIVEQLNRAYGHSLQQLKTKHDTVLLDSTIRIPVIFNVLYRPGSVTSEEHLDQLVQILNDGFNKGEDYSIVHPVFEHLIANVGIEFYRPETDKQGLPLKNVNLKYGIPTFNDKDDIKRADKGGINAYKPKEYLNIWIGGDNFSYPPSGAPLWEQKYFVADSLQGVVLATASVWAYDASQYEYYSKTVIHEVGHFLGLRHIWNKGIAASNGEEHTCGSDDGIKDTPRSLGPNYGCPSHDHNSCIDTLYEEFPDMTENYMDYTSSACKAMFTLEQKRLMLSNLFMFRPEIYELAVTEEVYSYPHLEMVVFPNPSSGQFTLQFADEHDSKSYELRVHNSLGQVILSKMIDADHHVDIDITTHATGVYTISLVDTDAYVFYKEKVVLTAN